MASSTTRRSCSPTSARSCATPRTRKGTRSGRWGAERVAAETPVPARCANCDTQLDGPYCSQCGQQAVDLHRPIRKLLSELIDDALSLDTRLVRTLRPLLFRPGLVTRDYLAGRRVAQVPPLRTYLISALVFFGLFSIFPNRAKV